MSFYDYKVGMHICKQNQPFYALIMAAMRQADTDNLEKLKRVFPGTFAELQERYDAPGGYLPDDPGYAELQVARKALFERAEQEGMMDTVEDSEA